MPEPVDRLAQHGRLIALENSNLALAEALAAMAALPAPCRSQDLCIALVASEELTKDFVATANVIQLDRHAWRNQLLNCTPDFVLVESDFSCSGGWRSDFLVNRETNALQQLAEHCEINGIPCALWVTLEESQLPLLNHLFAYFSALFVASPPTFTALSAVYGTKVKRFEPCVDGTSYNPGKPTLTPTISFAGAMPVVSDCLKALMYFDNDGQLLETIQKTLEYGIWLYEGDELIRPRESFMPAHFLRRSLGYLSNSAIRNVLKFSEVSLVLEGCNDRSYWRNHRKILKATASKSLVISTNIQEELFGQDLVAVVRQFLCAPNAGGIEERLQVLLNSRLLRERLQHLFYRRAMICHETEVRLHEMHFALASDGPKKCIRQPKVSVILPTYRPQNFQHALNQYRNQIYTNKELIVVVNTNETLLDPLRQQLRNEDNARILGVPSRWPIGVCLNAAILESQGEYWAKIDDDDIYGPWYLSDYVLNARFVDFDIAGKTNVFTYDEQGARTILRRSKERPHTLASTFAGGTLFARNRRSEMLFPENARGFVDIWFQWHHLAEGRLLYAVDPFNFMQVRRSDRRKHTWRLHVTEMGDGEEISSGLALEAVIV